MTPDPAAALAAAVLVPLLAALVCAPLRGRPQSAVAVAGGLGTAGAALLVVLLVARDGQLQQALGGWEPPLGIVVRADGPSAVFLALSAAVGTATTLYAAAAPRACGERRGFWPLWLLTWAGLHAVFLAADLFNAYVALEVLGLAAVGLVSLGGPASWRPALQYLLVAVLGSLLFLLAVAMVYGATGTLDVATAGERLGVEWGTGPADPSTTRWPLALATVGLALKTALFPLHGWLPSAHASAPSAVSPVLSALVVKGAFFVLLRMWFEVLGPDPVVATGLGVAGAGAVLWGGLLALRQPGLKRVVAYSTVAQVGYFFLVFPLVAAATGEDAVRAAWAGMVMMVAAHGLAKAALFMSAGTLLLAYGTDELPRLAAAARDHPMVVAAMTLSSVSLVGLPISLGFAAKWELMVSALTSSGWVWVAVLVAGSLLSAGYLFRPVAATLRGRDDAQAGTGPAAPAQPLLVRHVPLALATLAVVFGLLGFGVAELAVVGLPGPGGG